MPSHLYNIVVFCSYYAKILIMPIFRKKLSKRIIIINVEQILENVVMIYIFKGMRKSLFGR